MKTQVIKIDEDNIDLEKIKYVADILRNGGLVVFPTETVYGIGANALSKMAVENIFKAKGRPSDNPLIVHINDVAKAKMLCNDFDNDNFKKISQNFWPGSLTIVANKKEIVPDIVTAGLNTVAIRVPQNRIALKLLEYANVPVAAPSANISGRPSATAAKHVIEDLYSKVDIIIDGGNVEVGIESTVLDITSKIPVILRPGKITRENLEKVIGNVIDSKNMIVGIKESEIPKAPGMKYKHYSPNAKLILFEGSYENVIAKIKDTCEKFTREGKRVGIIATDDTKKHFESQNIFYLGKRDDLEGIARNLFYSFREMDSRGFDIILAQTFVEEGVGVAIMNRMKKASGVNIINAD